MAKDKLELLLTEQNADKIATYIVKRFDQDGSKENIDYDFDLKNGKMDSTIINTSFKFDTQSGTLLNKIKNMICSLENITDKQNEIILSFLIKIKDILNTKYKNQLANNIRKVVLNNAPEDSFPLSNTSVINFEVGETPPIDYIVVVQKEAPSNDIAGGVGQLLMKEHTKSGKELNEIIAEKKASGDPNYKYVTGAYKRKWYFECQLDMFVDYSLAPV